MKAVCCLLAALPLLAQLTVEKQHAIGRHYASEIRRQSRPFQHPAVDAYVRRVATKLAAHLPAVPSELTVEVITGSDHKEPFVFSPGYLFVPVAFLVAAEDEAQFVGMLAHAIGHLATPVEAQVVKTGNLGSIPLIWMGPEGAHAGASTGVLVPKAMLKDHAESEMEADRVGIDLASRAGFDTSGLRRYLARFGTDEARLMRLEATTPADPLSSAEFLAARDAVLESAPKRKPPTLRR